MIKLCNKCGVEKPLDDFHNDTKRKGGKYPHCKECQNSYMRNRYATNPDVKAKRIAYMETYSQNPNFAKEAKRRSLKHYSSVKGRAAKLLSAAKQSPDGCTLTLEWVMAGVERGYCQVTGIGFDLTNGHQVATGRVKNPYSPSLDRIDPKGSYSPDNVRVVIWQYNMMKGELSDSEILEICRRILARAAA